MKFASITARDADTERMLRCAGWLPVVVWEHEDMVVAAQRIQELDAHSRMTRRQHPAPSPPRTPPPQAAG